MPAKIPIKKPIIKKDPTDPTERARLYENRYKRASEELIVLKARVDMSLAELREDLTPAESRKYLSKAQIDEALLPEDRRQAQNFRACEYQACANCCWLSEFRTECKLGGFWLRKPSDDYTCDQWELEGDA